MASISRDLEKGLLCLLGTERVSVQLGRCRELLSRQHPWGEAQSDSPSLLSIPGLPALSRPRSFSLERCCFRELHSLPIRERALSSLKTRLHSLINRHTGRAKGLA